MLHGDRSRYSVFDLDTTVDEADVEYGETGEAGSGEDEDQIMEDQS